jgi:hypothetical protein
MRISFLSMPLQIVLHVSFNSTSQVLVVLDITCYAMYRQLILLLLLLLHESPGSSLVSCIWCSLALVDFGITCYAMCRLLLLLLGIMFHTMTRPLALLGMYFATIRELAALMLRSFTPQLVLLAPPINLMAARWSLGRRLVFLYTLVTRFSLGIMFHTMARQLALLKM